MTSLVLSGGLVIDGTGSAPRRADIAVTDGRIVAVQDRIDDGSTRVDVTDLCVTPGFVDIHTHSDPLAFLPEPQGFKALQGVTTEVFGNCGSSHGGLREHALADLGIQGRLLDEDQRRDRFRCYLDLVEKAGVVINTATLVGLTTVREHVGATDPVLGADMLPAMQAAVQEALDAGAVGVSSGLEYAPGSYADLAELTELARVAAGSDRLYVTHLRNEADLVLASLDEAIGVALATGVRLHVSHLKASGPAVHGQAPAMLDRLARAADSGLDVSADVYPYPACSTPMSALLPTSALSGDRAQLLARLADQDRRAELLRTATTDPAVPGCGIWRETTPESIRIVMHSRPQVAGRTLAEVLDGRTPWDALCDLLIDDLDAFTVLSTMTETDVATFLADDAVFIASDSVWPLDHGHPRTWGTFPHLLGHWSRERGVVSLPEAVRRSTSAPARRFGLVDRGRIRVGAYADLCVFDPAAVGHDADYLRPWQQPTGIRHVLVGGRFVVRDEVFVPGRHGQVLRSGADGLAR